MALQAQFHKHTLQFKFEAGTSRGSYTHKNTYFIIVWDTESPAIKGIGEASPLLQLSLDDRPDFETKLQHFCEQLKGVELPKEPSKLLELVENFIPPEFPSVRFGLETALLDWANGGKRIIFPSDFTTGKANIPINGLIWMGTKEFMLQQITEKIEQGYACLKLKIGALNFEQELEILAFIRNNWSEQNLTLRLDANGAFKPKEALAKLEQLAQYQIHSIEQPIAAEQEEEMAYVCRNSLIPIALDEELIYKTDTFAKEDLLQTVKPAFIILKPTLVGGIQNTLEWIEIAEKQHIGYWLTSALEANIGLNSIAQLTATLAHDIPQGLGTGSLYWNNIASPLVIKKDFLTYNSQKGWDISFI